MKSLRCILFIDSYCIISNNLPNQKKINNKLSIYSNTRIASKEIIQTARFFSTNLASLSPKSTVNITTLNDFSTNLSPFFITGLTDAEGSFSCIIKK